MIVKIYGQAYPCHKAEKGTDFVRLYDENNMLILSCEGISDFSGYAIEGGTWTVPVVSPTIDQRTAALESAMLTMLGGAANV